MRFAIFLLSFSLAVIFVNASIGSPSPPVIQPVSPTPSPSIDPNDPSCLCHSMYFQFRPPDLSIDYNVSCRFCDTSKPVPNCQSFFQIPYTGGIDINKILNSNPSDPQFCLTKTHLQMQCVQGNGTPMCYGGAFINMSTNFTFDINTTDIVYPDGSHECQVVDTNHPAYFNQCTATSTSICYFDWNNSATVNSSFCNPGSDNSTPSATPTVFPTITPNPSVNASNNNTNGTNATPTPSCSPNNINGCNPNVGGSNGSPTPTPSPAGATPTPTQNPGSSGSGGGSGGSGGGGGYYISPQISTCNAHFPLLANYLCTIKNLNTGSVTALTLCNSTKNFACPSQWNLPGDLNCGTNYEIICSETRQCFNDLQVKDFTVNFTAMCNPDSQIDACVITGGCTLNNPYHQVETLDSSNFDSTYCGFYSVLQKTTFCSINNDAFLKKGPVSLDLNATLVPFSNSILNNVFDSSQKEVGIGNNSFDQNALNGSNVSAADLKAIAVNNDLIKIRSNSGTELNQLSSTVNFLLYKLLPIVAVLSIAGLVVFLVRKRKLVIFRVASKSIPIHDAKVLVSFNNRTYSETTDARGYAQFHLAVEEKSHLRAQAFVLVNDIKLISKVYELEYNSQKEVQDLIIFDEKSIVTT
ncbi:Uncharacterised protein [uncultured archaeon]|nr:Uncharacterised protein [uncultured archaeon]